jgi:hypothetical protein
LKEKRELPIFQKTHEYCFFCSFKAETVFLGAYPNIALRTIIALLEFLRGSVKFTRLIAFSPDFLIIVGASQTWLKKWVNEK